MRLSSRHAAMPALVTYSTGLLRTFYALKEAIALLITSLPALIVFLFAISFGCVFIYSIYNCCNC